MSDYYDRQGNPMTREEWMVAFEPADRTSRRVGYDELPGGVVVSTVWLGLNHQWGDGPPLIFETMIFGGEHAEFQERYSTEAEALDGHRRAVELARG